MNGLTTLDFNANSQPYFRVISKNSRPQVELGRNELSSTLPYSWTDRRYNRYGGSDGLLVRFAPIIQTTYGQGTPETGPEGWLLPPVSTVPILTSGGAHTLLPTSNQMTQPNAEFAPLISPVFYADDLFTFFVEPSLTETTITDWKGYPSYGYDQSWDDLLVKALPISSQVASATIQTAGIQSQIDDLSVYQVKANPDALTQPGIAVQFGNDFVGATGIIQDQSSIKAYVTSTGGLKLGQ